MHLILPWLPFCFSICTYIAFEGTPSNTNKHITKNLYTKNGAFIRLVIKILLSHLTIMVKIIPWMLKNPSRNRHVPMVTVSATRKPMF